ncbi:MAG TPA: hypothetical protein VFQ92_11280 [Blastocatellia bacterium]|nr:hypothetical protein [Blastocatellia bacterium]
MDRSSAKSRPNSRGAGFWVVSLKAASLLIAVFLGLAAGRFGGTALLHAINPLEPASPSVTPTSTQPVEVEPEPPPVPEPPAPEESTRKEESIEERLKREAMKELRKRMKQAEREIRKRTGIGKEGR